MPRPVEQTEQDLWWNIGIATVVMILILLPNYCFNAPVKPTPVGKLGKREIEEAARQVEAARAAKRKAEESKLE